MNAEEKKAKLNEILMNFGLMAKNAYNDCQDEEQVMSVENQILCRILKYKLHYTNTIYENMTTATEEYLEGIKLATLSRIKEQRMIDKTKSYMLKPFRL